MSQPPYPPQGGNDPGGEQPAPQDWDREVGADDPTRRFDAPGPQRSPTQQFGQPEYGQSAQPPYGQPPYSQPPYGQPPYGHPSFGQPSYGQPGPQYGPPQYPPPQYGQGQYGQYGQVPYGQPWGPPGGPGTPRPMKKKTVIALVAGAVVLLVAIGAGLFFLLRAADPATGTAASGGFSSAPADPSAPAPSGAGGIPDATVTPDGLGEDPDLDELAQECYAGDMDSCDRLYEEAELDSLYGLYGGTCAGRQDVSDADTVFCADAFPEN